jgi:hypothetical protein
MRGSSEATALQCDTLIAAAVDLYQTATVFYNFFVPSLSIQPSRSHCEA